MKKVLVFILIATIVLTLTGCGSSGNTDNANNETRTDTSNSNRNPPPDDLAETPIADFEYTYNAELGGVVITKYLGNDLKVRIPEKIEGEPVKGIARGGGTGVFAKDSSRNYNERMINVYIPNSVTLIGDCAFIKCTKLTSITIPDSVTSIGNGAFDGCKDIIVTYKNKTYTYNYLDSLYK